MKKNDDHKKLVSSICEIGTFTDDLSDCEWCGRYCHKKELNPQQQYMENLISRVESARTDFRKAIKKELMK